MGAAASRVDEVQPPPDWQPSSNHVGFRLISPTSDISDPSCRIQQQRKASSNLPPNHLTPTLERRRTSKVVARNLPPRPRPVPTPSSFYFPTRESEDMVDRRGVGSRVLKAKKEKEEDGQRRLAKTKETLQKRALQAKQCLVACIEEPVHQIEKIKDRIVEGKAESKEDLVKQRPHDMDLNYNRLSTDTTRSVNAAVTKGDNRKKKTKAKWEPKVAEISETSRLKGAFFDESEGCFAQGAVPFEPVFRESHVAYDRSANSTSSGSVSSPLDPMFSVDIALHHEESYFKRLSAASQYGVSPGVDCNETKPSPIPSSDHYLSSPKTFDRNVNKEAMDTEIDSPVASLFMNDLFMSSAKATKRQTAGCDHQNDGLRPQIASAKVKSLKTVIDKSDIETSVDVSTERNSDISLRLDPNEAEDWLMMRGSMSPKVSQKKDIATGDCSHSISPDPQSGKIIVRAKLRKDSPFRPLVRGFSSKPFSVIAPFIGKSASAGYASADIARPKHEANLSAGSFDNYGAVHKLWLLPNALAAARAIGGLGTPNMSRWRTRAPSPADDSVHSSMMASPGPLLTDQALCNAAFLFSPSYVGGLDRLHPLASRRSDTTVATNKESSTIITTHGSRSHLPDYTRHSLPPVTIPISDASQLMCRHSHESTGHTRGRSLDSVRRVRFSSADEYISNSDSHHATKIESLGGRGTLAPSLKQREPTTTAEFTSYMLTKSDLASAPQYFLQSSGKITSTSQRHVSSEGPRPVQQNSTEFNDLETRMQPSTPDASLVDIFLEDGSPGGLSMKHTKDNVADHAADETSMRNSNSNGSPESEPLMYWSYRSTNGEMSAVTPMLGKKSARLATNSPFLRFKAAKNRFSNPPTKEPPVRKTHRKFAEVASGGIVSSRVTEIDGRLTRTRPRSLRKMVMKRGSGAVDTLASRGEMVEKPAFRNPVIMGFKAVSKLNEPDITVNCCSFAASAERAGVRELPHTLQTMHSRPQSLSSSLSFPFDDVATSSMIEVYKQLNKAPAASSESSPPSSLVTESSAVAERPKVTTPSSVGPFIPFDSTPVSPDHSEATDITKRGTLRTPLQHNSSMVTSSLQMSISSTGVSPEPSPLGSSSIRSGSSESDSPFEALTQNKKIQQTLSHLQYDRRDTISSETDASEDMFALISSHGKALLSPFVSDTSSSREDSELDPFDDELIRPSIAESVAESDGQQNRLESLPSQRSFLSDATSSESSRFFSSLRRDASLRSLAAESRRSNASGSTTLSAIMQKENLTYLPFRTDAPVKPVELRHHAAPSSLHLSPLQRTPMQASKWRSLAAAAHEKRRNQIRRGGVLSDKTSNIQD